MNLKKRKNRGLLVMGSIILILIIISLLSEHLAPFDPYLTDAEKILQPPDSQHIMGTDNHGRDLFSRLLVGSRTSVFASIIMVLVSSLLGTVIGIIGGFFGERTDSILMRFTDVFLSFPDMILAIAVAGILGGGLINAMIAIIAVTWTQYARLARGLTVTIKEESYIKAAKLGGCNKRQLIFRHILPNISSSIIVTGTIQISHMMMGLAGMSFLGIGVKIPQAEWGAMISEGRRVLQTAPWVALYPALILIVMMIIFNSFGELVRDAIDPKSK